MIVEIFAPSFKCNDPVLQYRALDGGESWLGVELGTVFVYQDVIGKSPHSTSTSAVMTGKVISKSVYLADEPLVMIILDTVKQ